MATMPESKRKIEDQSKLTGQDLRASSIGWEIAVPIVGGPVLGHFLEKRLNTGVNLALIFLIFGIMAGGYFLLRYIYYEYLLQALEEDDDDSD